MVSGGNRDSFFSDMFHELKKVYIEFFHIWRKKIAIPCEWFLLQWAGMGGEWRPVGQAPCMDGRCGSPWCIKDWLHVQGCSCGCTAQECQSHHCSRRLPVLHSPSCSSRSIARAGTDGLMGGNVYRKVQVSWVSGMKPPSAMISELMSWSSLKQPDWQECKGLFKKETRQVSNSGEQQEVFSNKRCGSSRGAAWMGLALKRTLKSVVHTM